MSARNPRSADALVPKAARGWLSEGHARSVALELRARVLAHLDEHPGRHGLDALARDVGATVWSIRAVVLSLADSGELLVHTPSKGRMQVELA